MNDDEIIMNHEENSDYLNTIALQGSADTWEGVWFEIRDMLKEARKDERARLAEVVKSILTKDVELIIKDKLPDDEIKKNLVKKVSARFTTLGGITLSEIDEAYIRAGIDEAWDANRWVTLAAGVTRAMLILEENGVFASTISAKPAGNALQEGFIREVGDNKV